MRNSNKSLEFFFERPTKEDNLKNPEPDLVRFAMNALPALSVVACAHYYIVDLDFAVAV